MATAAQLRKMLLALPDVEEAQHMDHPDFRRGGKIFAGLTKDEKTANLRLSPEVQATLPMEPDSAFEPAAGASGRKGWTRIDLARAEASVLKALVREAWELIGVPAAKRAKPAKKKSAPKRR